MDYNQITQIKNTDTPVLFAETSCAYKLNDRQMRKIPPLPNIDALRRCLSDLFDEKMDHNWRQLEARCDIKEDTFSKVLRYSAKRNITAELLAKFCVGVGLTPEEAKDLFALTEHPLNDQYSRWDYILLSILENEEDVSAFDKTLREHGCKGVLSKAD